MPFVLSTRADRSPIKPAGASLGSHWPDGGLGRDGGGNPVQIVARHRRPMKSQSASRPCESESPCAGHLRAQTDTGSGVRPRALRIGRRALPVSGAARLLLGPIRSCAPAALGSNRRDSFVADAISRRGAV